MINYFKSKLQTFIKTTVGLTSPKQFYSTFGDYFNLNSNKNYVSWVFDCLEVYAKHFTKVQFRLYEKQGDGELEEVKTHPILELINNPNPYQTRWEILFRKAQHWGLYGNCYLYKLRNGFNLPMQLIQLLPSRLTPMSVSNYGGIDYYQYDTGYASYKLMPQDVIHFKNPDPDNISIGKAIVANILDQSEVDQLQTAYMKQFYKRGGFLGQVFSTDQVLTDKVFERAEEALHTKFSGSDNAFKVALFDGGLRPVNESFNMRDMDFASSRNHTRDEIFSAFNINKFLVGQSEGINRANAFEITRQFTSQVIEPIMTYFDEVYTKSLCAEFSTDYCIKHDNISPKDIENDLMYYESGIKNGWLSPDEVRKWEDLEPYNLDYTIIPLDLSKQRISNQKEKENESA